MSIMPIMRSYKDLNIDYQGDDLQIDVKQLTSLTGCPPHITGYINCANNKITSSVGGPQIVDGNYYCSNNHLTDLIGCASHIGGTVYCYTNNKITSLVGIHKIIKSCNAIFFDADQVTQGGIGFLLIDNLTDISDFMIPFKIIKSYLGTGTKGMMVCRAELIDNGYSEYAKL